MENKKRVSLYFNLDVPSDKILWDYLESNGRKSEIIKRLLRNEINGVQNVPIPSVPKEETIINTTDIDYILDDILK